MSPTSMGPLSVNSSVPSPEIYPQGVSPSKSVNTYIYCVVLLALMSSEMCSRLNCT